MLDLLPAEGRESILSHVLSQKVTAELIVQTTYWQKRHKSVTLVEPFISLGILGNAWHTLQHWKGDDEPGPCFIWVGFRQVKREKEEWRRMGMLPSHLGSS